MTVDSGIEPLVDGVSRRELNPRGVVVAVSLIRFALAAGLIELIPVVANFASMQRCSPGGRLR